MSKKIGIGYSFKEKNLQKENEELKAKLAKLEKESKRSKVENNNKKAEGKKSKAE